MIKFFFGKAYRLLLENLSTTNRVKLRYFRVYKKLPNIKKPKTFNEKVISRILGEQKDIYSTLADKYLVRRFVSERVGEEYLIPLHLATSNPSDLLKIDDWSGLVIKPNHAAGMIYISDDNPSKEEKDNVVTTAKTWLKTDFSSFCDEMHYSKIKPMLLVERKITKRGEIPRDYKFHCFKQKNGDINFVLQLVDGRFGQESRSYFLNSFENMVWSHGAGNHLLSNNEIAVLNEVILLNKRLILNDFNYVRIDWYILGDRIYFGEITFTPGAGIGNEFGPALEKKMAEWWEDEY